MRSHIMILPVAAAAATAASPDAGLRQALERTRYALEDSGHGVYRGENPAHRPGTSGPIGDGVVQVVFVQKEIDAALGLGCTY